MRILVIDDEANIRRTTALALESMGHEAVTVGNGRAAVQEADKGSFDLAFLDLRLGSEDGLEVLTKLMKAEPRMAVVVFTAFASVETAVEAMRLGAFDYIPKPFTPEQIRQVLNRLSRTRQLESRVAELEWRLSAESPDAELASDEPAMQKVLELALKAASTPATILLLGESGTGKSVLARAIHQHSAQKERAFVTVNCPSLSRELLESELFGHVKGAFTGAVGDTFGKVAAADGGTLFLDEIGELPLEIQPKLLRLLQEKEYERVGEPKPRRANVRLVSATNRDLEQAVKTGQFREDLFYRLNVISIRMPALRERPADLVKIAHNCLQFFASQIGKEVNGFTPEALQALRGYAWPGNLRELRNVIERATILANHSHVDAADLPENLHRRTESGITVGASVSLEELEAEHIKRVIANAGSLDQAAQILGIDPATLYRKRKKMGLAPPTIHRSTRDPSNEEHNEIPEPVATANGRGDSFS